MTTPTQPSPRALLLEEFLAMADDGRGPSVQHMREAASRLRDLEALRAELCSVPKRWPHWDGDRDCALNSLIERARALGEK